MQDELDEIAGVLYSMRDAINSAPYKTNDYPSINGGEMAQCTHAATSAENMDDETKKQFIEHNLDEKASSRNGRSRRTKSIYGRKILRSGSPNRVVTSIKNSRSRSPSVKRRSYSCNSDSDSHASYDSDVNVFDDNISVDGSTILPGQFTLKRRATPVLVGTKLPVSTIATGLENLDLLDGKTKPETENLDSATNLSEIKAHYRSLDYLVCTEATCTFHCKQAVEMNAHRSKHEKDLCNSTSKNNHNNGTGNQFTREAVQNNYFYSNYQFAPQSNHLMFVNTPSMNPIVASSTTSNNGDQMIGANTSLMPLQRYSYYNKSTKAPTFKFPSTNSNRVASLPTSKLNAAHSKSTIDILFNTSSSPNKKKKNSNGAISSPPSRCRSASPELNCEPLPSKKQTKIHSISLNNINKSKKKSSIVVSSPLPTTTSLLPSLPLPVAKNNGS